MRIGLNLLFLLPGVVGGTETHAVNLLRALSKVSGSNQFLLFMSRENAATERLWKENWQIAHCPIPTNLRTLRYAWEQLVLPLQAKILGLDLVHSLGYVQPIRLPCKSVVTIHDLNFHNIGDMMSWYRRVALRFFVTKSARAADHIVTVSEFSKAQMVKLLRIPPEKVTVICNGPKPPPLNRARFEDVSKKYGVSRPYIFALSSASPHKNIHRLILAFNRLKEKTKLKDLKLVLAGHLPQDRGDLIRLCRRPGCPGGIVFTGYVPDEVLATLYEYAELFVFPSLYEGFGIPVLEAFQYGVPVACSKAAALPEVAGDAAFYFEPSDVREMADVIEYLLDHDQARRMLTHRGRQRLAHFTWERAALNTLEVYRRVFETG